MLMLLVVRYSSAIDAYSLAHSLTHAPYPIPCKSGAEHAVPTVHGDKLHSKRKRLELHGQGRPWDIRVCTYIQFTSVSSPKRSGGSASIGSEPNTCSVARHLP